MSKFCSPECPLRGNCTGEIASVETVLFERSRLSMGLRLKWEDTIAFVTECTDVNGGVSRLFQGVNPETILSKLEACPGYPEEKQVPEFIPFRKDTIRACGALGVGPNAFLYEEPYRQAQTDHDSEE